MLHRLYQPTLTPLRNKLKMFALNMFYVFRLLTAFITKPVKAFNWYLVIGVERRKNPERFFNPIEEEPSFTIR